MARLVCGVIVVTALLACGGGRPPSEPVETRAREVVNLRAFARLYGVVRWFHPSDEAAEVDWNRFAVNGVATARDAADQAALERALEAMVSPIGAGIVIGTADEVAKARPIPPLPMGGKVERVAWKHLGPGFDDGGGGAYQSKRTNRPAWKRGGAGWGAFSQAVDAAPLRGKKVQLRADLRAGKDTRVGAWLRVDRPGDATGFFDNMMDRPVTSAAWARGTIEGVVDADAVRVVVGGLVMGDDGWFDDFVLEVANDRGGWTAVALGDAGFEGGHAAWSTGIGKRDTPGYELVVEPNTHDRSAAAHVRASKVPVLEDPFAAQPAGDEVALVDLGDGLWAQVPMVLASVDGHTVPKAGARTFASALGAAVDGSRDDTVAIADVIVAWNVFTHFYPYLDVIATDWHAYLDEALTAAVAARGDVRAVNDVVRAIIVAAEDGHGRLVTDPPRTPLPAVFELVDEKVVVIASADPALAPGDEILSIDGVAAAAALEAERAKDSGSPQSRTHGALRSLGSGPAGSAAAIELRRAGAAMSPVVKRGSRPPIVTYPPVGEIEPGIWLVDLGRAEMDAIDAKMDAIAAAKGVIFDMRGYPNSTHDVLAHLMDAAEHDRWMHAAQILRPNLPGQPLPAHTFESYGWDMVPVAPRIRGKVVFLTGPGAISYAESVMGYVEALGLPIVGAATAGTNGNVRQVGLPSGAAFAFTGMKVTRHDGTRSHLEGIRPTVPVSRTITGVAAGRDEVIERALAIIR